MQVSQNSMNFLRNMKHIQTKKMIDDSGAYLFEN